MKTSEGMLFIFLLGTLGIWNQIEESDCHMHVQHVYPGCKSSPNLTDISYPECNLSNFQQIMEDGPLKRADKVISTGRLKECFRNSSQITIPSPLQLSVQFFGRILPEDNFSCPYGSCACKLVLTAPPLTYFKIYAEYVNMFFYWFDVQIYEGSAKTMFGYQDEKPIMTSGNNITFEMTVNVNHVSVMSFSFRFDSFPECHRQLQVKCLSNTSGILETPGWSAGDKYLNQMDSCVTLHVPDNHVTMVSLVSMDVELQRNQIDCYDYLLLSTDESCPHPTDAHDHDDKSFVCRAQDLPPTVIRGSKRLSLRFRSDYNSVKTGFRVLYSFHTKGEEPLQLSDGTWDCTVPYYSSFQQHFTCIEQSFCSDKRDKVRCPETNLCGSNLVMFAGSCYRLFKPEDATTWNKASETCANYRGNLVILNTAFKLQKTAALIRQTQLYKPVFVGLQITASSTLLEMYQNTWSWVDKTLAVYLPIVFHKVDAPYCAVFDSFHMTMVTCDKKVDAAFMCETDFTPNQAMNSTTITLPTPSSRSLDSMTTCRNDHITHAFLACDVSTNCSARSQEETLACSKGFSPPVPFFTCRNQMERVPYTLVCDFRSDCCDGSDEDFCDFPACESRTEYQCADGKQCIRNSHVCNKHSDCEDGSDEMKCWDSLTSCEVRANEVEPPARVDFIGDGNINVTRLDNTSTCPETHFQCPGDGYCLPVYVRCNGFNDCPGKEDEMNCDYYTCPGFYRCRQSPICLHSEHLCDGIFQCPQHDDEWMCNFTCPDNCHCYGHAFICTGFFSADSYPELRYVDASSTAMKLEHFLNNTKLIHLTLKNCRLTMLQRLNFSNLRHLDLSYNNIREIDIHQFLLLKNLVSLSLAYNLFSCLDSFLFATFRFPKMTMLNISGITLPYSNDTILRMFPNVKYLNISNSGITKLTEAGFTFLKSLRTLDLRGCPIETFYPGVFDSLDQLELVYTDNYKLCCPADLPKGMESRNCHAPRNEISSCDALLRSDVFRVFLVVYAILALVGNAGSFIYRACVEKSVVKLGFEVFVTHLSIADFLMGVYLAIIGIADRVYYGNYRWKDSEWKDSVACKLAGFLSLLSSELSAFLISLITLERVLVIGFPHKNLRFNRVSAHAASVAVWLIGLALAAIPLLPSTSHWDFYSQSGICVPLPITRKQFDGSDYAFGVVIIMNFILFLFIAVGQLLIYWSIWVNTVGCNNNSRKSRDTTIARRLLAVVMTDFLCWFPIGLLGMMARSGVPISGEINVAMAIFVLPFNSALNPFLYTFDMLMERRRKMASARKSEGEGEIFSFQSRATVFDIMSESRKEEITNSRKEKITYSREEACQLLKRFVEDGLLTPDQVRQQIW